MISTAQASAAAAAEPMTVTRTGPRRRESRPPPKSELPYNKAAARPSRIPMIIPRLVDWCLQIDPPT